MMKIIGYLNQTGSKRGEQYAEIAGVKPFQFTANLTIKHKNEEANDEMIVKELSPFYGHMVAIECDVDEEGNLTTTIDQIFLENS